jgi:hypothetical protein
MLQSISTGKKSRSPAKKSKSKSRSRSRSPAKSQTLTTKKKYLTVATAKNLTKNTTIVISSPKAGVKKPIKVDVVHWNKNDGLTVKTKDLGEFELYPDPRDNKKLLLGTGASLVFVHN